MAKFNVVQKRRRALIARKKRATQGDPQTGKLKNKPQPLSISGKRKRKLLKKWRREQKNVIEKGLIAVQDVEMAVAEGEGASHDGNRIPAKFNVKKSLKLKQLKCGGKKNSKVRPASNDSKDAMVVE